MLTDNIRTNFCATCKEKADRIEAQAAEIERLEKAIKIQASAVRTLQANEDTEINILRKQKREWHQAVLSLDSEREANAILTTEIEQWKVDYDCAMMDVERLREAGQKLNDYACHDDDCQIVTHGVWSDPIPCTCGYEDAWKAWAELGDTK